TAVRLLPVTRRAPHTPGRTSRLRAARYDTSRRSALHGLRTPGRTSPVADSRAGTGDTSLPSLRGKHSSLVTPVELQIRSLKKPAAVKLSPSPGTCSAPGRFPASDCARDFWGHPGVRRTRATGGALEGAGGRGLLHVRSFTVAGHRGGTTEKLRACLLLGRGPPRVRVRRGRSSCPASLHGRPLRSAASWRRRRVRRCIARGTAGRSRARRAAGYSPGRTGTRWRSDLARRPRRRARTLLIVWGLSPWPGSCCFGCGRRNLPIKPLARRSAY